MRKDLALLVLIALAAVESPARAGTLEKTEQKPGRVKSEYLLLEMPSVEANIFEISLLRCKSNPAALPGEVTAALKEGLTIWSGVSESGKKFSDNKYGFVIFTATINSDGAICNTHLTILHGFQTSKYLHKKGENIYFDSCFSASNGLPVILARRDLSGLAEILVARVAWDLPSDKAPLAEAKQTMLSLRANLVTVPREKGNPSANLRADPALFAVWLKSNGVSRASISVTLSGDDKQSYVAAFDNLVGGARDVRLGRYNYHSTFVCGPLDTYNTGGSGALDCGKFTVVLNLGNGKRARFISASRASKLPTIPIGGSAAVPCEACETLEIAPGGRSATGRDLYFPADDLFIILEPLPYQMEIAPSHFYNTN